jgi:hypothetical protein
MKFQKKLSIAIVSLLLAPFLAAVVFAESNDVNWPSWRGPNSTGVAPKGKPPLRWSETENVKWKAAVPGEGNSSPVVWNNQIFFQTAIKTDRKVTPEAPEPSSALDADAAARGFFFAQDRGREGRRREGRGGRRGRGRGKKPSHIYKFDLVCLDRVTGKTLWQKTAREELPHEGHHKDGSFASSSPVTDGKHVWASFGSRGLHCYRVDGGHVWSIGLDKMQTRNSFGEGASPALAGDAVIVPMDHEGDSYIIAVNKKTGDEIWKMDRDERTGWSTPLVLEVEGKLQAIVNAGNRVRSYDVKSGEVVWECGGQTVSAVPTPVSGQGMVFCTSGFRGAALLAIQLGKSGDLTGSDAVAWEVNEATPYVPSPLLYGENIYVCSGNKAIVSCYQVVDGKPRFVKQRLEGMTGIYASPVGAAGRIYFAGRGGMTKVIDSGNEFKILAENKLDDAFATTPAIAGGDLFLKGKKNLYCIAASGR